MASTRACISRMFWQTASRFLQEGPIKGRYGERGGLADFFTKLLRLHSVLSTFVAHFLQISQNMLVERGTVTKRIPIEFNRSGEGQMSCTDLGSFGCLAHPVRQHQTNLTVNPVDKSTERFSDEFQKLLKWCILICGRMGIYIHDGPDNLAENGVPKNGCIHLGSGNAKRVFDWLNERTCITISNPGSFGEHEVEIWHLLNRVESVEQCLLHAERTGINSASADKIVAAAMKYADNSKVFANGCSEIIRSAYFEGGITIPGNYTANEIMNNYTAVSMPLPGDIAGSIDSANGHVVIYLGPNSYFNCHGPGECDEIQREYVAFEFRTSFCSTQKGKHCHV